MTGTTGPSPLWYASRGLGLTLLIVLSLTLVLGILTSRRAGGDGWPRFVVAGLHRNLALLALVLVPLHALGAILDSFAGLGLRDMLLPFASAYRPLWLGLGVLGGELMVAVTLTSLVRGWLGPALWRLTHWAVYAAWPLTILHGLGTGSDTRFGWALAIYAACVVAVGLAVLVRLLSLPRERRSLQLAGTTLLVAGLLATAVFTLLGPAQPGWARAAGTPPALLGHGPTSGSSGG
ncbi:MAG: ferric reductase-like transmembrane domain-containing protein [Candidatus Dormibacteraeota bacterium]|nr:ferric reductase-like transmembrane domain-containing protein [Candidatus Dormibacteraeota bacterium]